MGETSTPNPQPSGNRHFHTLPSINSNSLSSSIPKMMKLDFPIYDGRDDPTTWLHDIAESDKVTLASFHLEGDISKMGSPPGLTNQFEDYFVELIKLREIGSVMDYQCKFERLLAKIEILAPEKKVSCFVADLKDNVQTDVQANRLTTLTMTIGLAKLYEARDNKKSAPATQEHRPVPSQAVKRMTPEELTERRKKGLCFHCHDKYAPGHNCAKNFPIEACWEEGENDVEMEIDDEIQEVVPEISLHAIIGCHKGDDELVLCGITNPNGKAISNT
ncbi:hypothetical protein ACOSQ3_013336 [Xanthoceras sorbifolium]